MKREPFIKKIKTSKNCYIYDVNSNELIQVNQIIFDIIDEMWDNDIEAIIKKFRGKYNEVDISNNFESIKTLIKEHNCFSYLRPKISSGFKSKNDLKSILNSELSQIILEVTDRCGNRCKYCVFSGSYSHSRKHGSKDMLFDTAKRATEFFIKRSKSNHGTDPPAITFYGGEPLLKFDLISKIHEFVKSKYQLNKYDFSLTTNGTILTDEIIRYLINHDISIMVSLDGPKQIHDRYRVFYNGRGTFDSIIKNLERIKTLSTDYFFQKISYNVVLAPPYDFNSIIKFFFEDDFFKNCIGKLKFNFVDAYGTTFFKDFNLENEQKLLYIVLKSMRERYKDALINDNYNSLTIEKGLFMEDFQTIVFRPILPLGNHYHPRGACIPGQRRLFVDTNGMFYMCEKVCHNFKIGNIFEGFNFNRILEFYHEYDNFFSECSNCWALRLCKKCFNNIRDGEKFDKKRKDKMCRRKLKRIEENLKIFCEIIEKNPDAFKVFKNVIVS